MDYESFLLDEYFHSLWSEMLFISHDPKLYTWMDNSTVHYYIADIVLSSNIFCIVSSDGAISHPFIYEYFPVKISRHLLLGMAKIKCSIVD